MLSKIQKVVRQCEEGKIDERELCISLEMLLFDKNQILRKEDITKNIKTSLREKFNENKVLNNLTDKLKVPYERLYDDENDVDTHEIHIDFDEFRVILIKTENFETIISVTYALNEKCNRDNDDDYYENYNKEYKSKEIVYEKLIDKYK